MKKKLIKTLAVVMCVIVVLTAVPLSGFVGLDLPSLFDFKAKASSSPNKCGANVTWSFNEGTGALNITGSGDMYNWGNVAYVPWYYFRSEIRFITIGEGVTSIGPNIFDGCSSLEGVTIGGSVRTIKENAFKGCSNLSSIIIPDSVTSIGNYAFSSCSNLTDVKLPNKLSAISYGLFHHCTSLQNITIPQTVTTINANAFNGCSSLTNITLPENINTIATSLFYGCTNLKSITIPKNVTSIDQEAFMYCESIESITIPENVTSIGGYAFSNCVNLKSVTLNDNLTFIGTYAFAKCVSLMSVTLPNGITDIAPSAFEDCSNLESINLPDSISVLGEAAFCGCSSLKSVKIPEKITDISPDLFRNCTSVTKIILHNNVKTIGEYSFANCSSVTSVTFPDSITDIYNYAFGWCYNLTEYEVPEGANVRIRAFYLCGTESTNAKINITDNIYTCYLEENFFISGNIQAEKNVGDVTLKWNSESGVEIYTPATVANISDKEATFSIKAKGIEEGIYTVTVTVPSGESDSCTVVVIKPKNELKVDVKFDSDYYYLYCDQLKNKSEQNIDYITATVTVTNKLVTDSSRELPKDLKDKLKIENIKLQFENLKPDAVSFESREKSKNTLYATIGSLDIGESEEITIKIYPFRWEKSFFGKSYKATEIITTASAKDFDNIKIENNLEIKYFIEMPDNETFSFVNTEKEFVGNEENPEYIISDEAMSKIPLINLLDVYAYKKFKKWGGSCFGMSTMVSAFNSRWISPNSFGGDCVYGINSPVKNIELRDAINIQQCSQATRGFVSEILLPQATFTQKQLRKNLVEAVKNIVNGGPAPVIGLKEPGLTGKSHAVVAYHLYEEDGYYIIYAVDPNYQSETCYFKISTDYSSYLYNAGSNYTEIKYILTDRSHIDIDTYAPELVTPINKSDEKYGFTVMTISDFDTVTITNSVGESATLSYSEGTVEGDLDVYVDTISGDGNTVRIIIEDDPAKIQKYTIKSTNGGMNLIINNNNTIGIAVVSDAEKATVKYSSLGKINLFDFGNSDYIVGLSDMNTTGDDILMLSVSGNNSEYIQLESKGDKIKLQSDDFSNAVATLTRSDKTITEETYNLKSENSERLIVETNPDNPLDSFNSTLENVILDDFMMIYKITQVINYIISTENPENCKIEFSTSDASVVTIDENGNITSIGTGKAIITVNVTDEYGNIVEDACEVTVEYSWWQWIIIIVFFGWIWY